MEKVIHNQPQQVRVDPSLAVVQECPHCQSKHFDKAFVLGVVPGIANPTGKDVMIEKPVWVCYGCKKPLVMKEGG